MTRLVLPLTIALGSAACMHAARSGPSHAEQPATAAAQPAPGSPHGGMAGMCPMDVPGTRVSADDTAAGVAVTFTTTPDQAPALRERVHAMVDMHNRHHAGDGAGPAGHHGMHGGAAGAGQGGEAGHGAGMEGHMGGMEMPPPSRAAFEELPDGARIVVTPDDPADADRLRKTVRMHAEHMQEHGCPMERAHG